MILRFHYPGLSHQEISRIIGKYFCRGHVCVGIPILEEPKLFRTLWTSGRWLLGDANIPSSIVERYYPDNVHKGDWVLVAIYPSESNRGNVSASASFKAGKYQVPALRSLAMCIPAEGITPDLALREKSRLQLLVVWMKLHTETCKVPSQLKSKHKKRCQSSFTSSRKDSKSSLAPKMKRSDHGFKDIQISNLHQPENLPIICSQCDCVEVPISTAVMSYESVGDVVLRSTEVLKATLTAQHVDKQLHLRRKHLLVLIQKQISTSNAALTFITELVPLSASILALFPEKESMRSVLTIHVPFHSFQWSTIDLNGVKSVSGCGAHIDLSENYNGRCTQCQTELCEAEDRNRHTTLAKASTTATIFPSPPLPPTSPTALFSSVPSSDISPVGSNATPIVAPTTTSPCRSVDHLANSQITSRIPSQTPSQVHPQSDKPTPSSTGSSDSSKSLSSISGGGTPVTPPDLLQVPSPQFSSARTKPRIQSTVSSTSSHPSSPSTTRKKAVHKGEHRNAQMEHVRAVSPQNRTNEHTPVVARRLFNTSPATPASQLKPTHVTGETSQPGDANFQLATERVLPGSNSFITTPERRSSRDYTADPLSPSQGDSTNVVDISHSDTSQEFPNVLNVLNTSEESMAGNSILQAQDLDPYPDTSDPRIVLSSSSTSFVSSMHSTMGTAHPFPFSQAAIAAMHNPGLHANTSMGSTSYVRYDAHGRNVALYALPSDNSPSKPRSLDGSTRATERPILVPFSYPSNVAAPSRSRSSPPKTGVWQDVWSTYSLVGCESIDSHSGTYVPNLKDIVRSVDFQEDIKPQRLFASPNASQPCSSLSPQVSQPQQRSFNSDLTATMQPSIRPNAQTTSTIGTSNHLSNAKEDRQNSNWPRMVSTQQAIVSVQSQYSAHFPKLAPDIEPSANAHFDPHPSHQYHFSGESDSNELLRNEEKKLVPSSTPFQTPFIPSANGMCAQAWKADGSPSIQDLFIALVRGISVFQQALASVSPTQRTMSKLSWESSELLEFSKALDTIKKRTYGELQKRSLVERKYSSRRKTQQDIQTSAEAVENTREMFLRAGFAPVLVQIVYLVSPSFQQPRQALEDALQSLCNLAFNYNGQIELTKPELRLVSTLYFRMELDSHVAEIQGKICRLLLALAHENSKTQDEVCKLGLLHLAIDILKNHKNEKFPVTRAIEMIVAVSKSPYARDIMISSNAIDLLRALDKVPWMRNGRDNERQRIEKQIEMICSVIGVDYDE